MTKRLPSKYKIARRLGVNLWGRPKSPTNRRDYRPGQHGQRRRKTSDFGTQLAAKQKLRGYYGNITERQFRRVYKEAVRCRGDTGEILVGLLERRLDATVYRMKFVPTVFAARQFVNHGHVLVNGRRVNIPSYRVSEGDVVEVREKSIELFQQVDRADTVRIVFLPESAESSGIAIKIDSDFEETRLLGRIRTLTLIYDVPAADRPAIEATPFKPPADIVGPTVAEVGPTIAEGRGAGNRGGVGRGRCRHPGRQPAHGS